MCGDLVGTIGLTTLVVVTSEESTSVYLPEILLDGCDAGCSAALLANTGQDVQPCNDSPKTVLLTDVVATGAEALLTADVHLVRVEKTTEEFPACRNLVALNTLLLGNEIDRARGGHASCETVDALLLEVWNELSVVRDDSQAVTGRNEAVGAVDHVPVAITVTGRAEVDAILVNRVHKRLGVDKIGIGVVATEIGLGYAVLGAVWDTELLLKDVDTIIASNTAQAIEEDLEVRVLFEE